MGLIDKWVDRTHLMLVCITGSPQVGGREFQHVRRQRRARTGRGPQEEDRHRGHLPAVPGPRGEQPLPGLFLLPLPALREPHEQTQECY